MICIGVPVCRPLYKQYIDRWTSRDRSKYQEHSGGGSYPLRTFGGSETPGRSVTKDKSVDPDNDSDPSLRDDVVMYHERKIGIKGPFTKAYAMGGNHVKRDDQSDEEILGPDFRRSQMRTDVESQEAGIRFTEEFKITSTYV